MVICDGGVGTATDGSRVVVAEGEVCKDVVLRLEWF